MKIEPAATFAGGLEASQFPLVDEVLSLADSGSLTLVGKSVSPWPGKAAINRVASALQTLGVLQNTQLLVARSWLSANARNLLVVKFELNSRTKAIIRDCYVSQQPFGCWQDPALFRKGKLLFWSCTHEGDAVVFGSQDWLQSRGLSPRRAEPIDVSVQELDLDAKAQVMAMLRER